MALLPLRRSRPTTRRETVLTEGSILPNPSPSWGLRPSQQLLRELGGSMHGMSSWYAPETARLDLGGTRRTRVDRRTSFATSNTKEDVAFSTGALEFADSLSTTGIMGLDASESMSITEILQLFIRTKKLTYPRFRRLVNLNLFD
jgi:hypothetical protein